LAAGEEQDAQKQQRVQEFAKVAGHDVWRYLGWPAADGNARGVYVTGFGLA
jgi:hypothetical protein